MNTPSPSTTEPPAQPVRGKRETDRINRRERLLDAAERRFAEAGYEGTALRDVTADAGTRLASVTDEFGGKEQLFREVLLRRALPLQTDRLQMLDAIPDDVLGAERVGAIIDAFVHPMLTRVQAHDGWGYYFQFIAQLANSPNTINLLVADEFNRIARPFVDALSATFIGPSIENTYDAYLFMLSTVLEVFAENRRMDSMSNNEYSSADLPRRYRALRTFTTAGIVALLTDPLAQQPPTIPTRRPGKTSETRPANPENLNPPTQSDTTGDRYQRGLDKLAEYTAPEAGQTHLAIAESLQDLAPDVARYIIEFAYGDIYTRPGLDNQQRAMITLASLITLGTEAQVELHLNTALTSGIEPDTIVELMVQLIPYTGFPRVLNGLGVAKHVFAQRNIGT